MFFEYALEPAALSNWERVRFFLDAFGPWKGRFLARYPGKWRRMVYAALVDCPDVEKKRICERLHNLDKNVFSPRSNAPYDGTKTWLDNAKIEHGRRAFRAIIADAQPNEQHHALDYVLDAALTAEDDGRWRVDAGAMIQREPNALAVAIELLLQASSRVLVVDPYFRADQGDKILPIAALARALVGSSASLEVHFGDGIDYWAWTEAAQRALPSTLPCGLEIKLCSWKERSGGGRMHNRYVLTDIGGVQLGDSIERGDPGHFDRISILDEPSRATLWEQYTGLRPSFDAVGPPLIVRGRSEMRG